MHMHVTRQCCKYACKILTKEGISKAEVKELIKQNTYSPRKINYIINQKIN